MKLRKELEISTGHRLPNHKSKCFNFHGHNYIVMIEIDFGYMNKFIKNKDGFLVDFGDIKEIINEGFDHKFLIYEKDPTIEIVKELPGMRIVDYIPTAENIALDIQSLIYNKIMRKVEVRPEDIKVIINETKNSQIEL